MQLKAFLELSSSKINHVYNHKIFKWKQTWRKLCMGEVKKFPSWDDGVFVGNYWKSCISIGKNLLN